MTSITVPHGQFQILAEKSDADINYSLEMARQFLGILNGRCNRNLSNF